jgi:hypothetical protein
MAAIHAQAPLQEATVSLPRSRYREAQRCYSRAAVDVFMQKLHLVRVNRFL